jgi:hypothetical protein
VLRGAPPVFGAPFAATCLALFVFVSPAQAGTAIDLTDRIVIDGSTADYLDDETIFQRRVVPQGDSAAVGALEESTIDSKWGRFNDINNIRVTWDAHYLYVAVEGYSFNNNMMIFFDTLPLPDGQAPGWTSFSSIEGGWRRAVSFDNGFNPEVFLASWDGNTVPQLWTYTGPNRDSQVATGSFPTAATFSRDLPDRAMEAAIPWDTVFLGKGTWEYSADYGDSVYVMPTDVTEIRLAAWVTTGGDGGGGPDTAPDNISGTQVDSAVPVVLDNFVRIPLDRVNASGGGSPDHVPDFDVPVRVPSTQQTPDEYAAYVKDYFFVPPPVRGQALQIDQFVASPKAIAPELGDVLHFRFTVAPPITDENLRRTRRIPFTVRVFDMNGERVRTIYDSFAFTPADLENPDPPAANVFDGRDDRGNMLKAGVYVLQVVLEPGLDQSRRGIAVVR